MQRFYKYLLLAFLAAAAITGITLAIIMMESDSSLEKSTIRKAKESKQASLVALQEARKALSAKSGDLTLKKKVELAEKAYRDATTAFDTAAKLWITRPIVNKPIKLRGVAQKKIRTTEEPQTPSHVSESTTSNNSKKKKQLKKRKANEQEGKIPPATPLNTHAAPPTVTAAVTDPVLQTAPTRFKFLNLSKRTKSTQGSGGSQAVFAQSSPAPVPTQSASTSVSGASGPLAAVPSFSGKTKQKSSLSSPTNQGATDEDEEQQEEGEEEEEEEEEEQGEEEEEQGEEEGENRESQTSLQERGRPLPSNAATSANIDRRKTGGGRSGQKLRLVPAVPKRRS